MEGLPASAEVEKHITTMPVRTPLYEAALRALAMCLDYQPPGRRTAAYQDLCDDALCAMAACREGHETTQIEDPATRGKALAWRVKDELMVILAAKIDLRGNPLAAQRVADALLRSLGVRP